jgi:hypothetical protein
LVQLFLDAAGQVVILLYLIDRESSLLMVGPSAIGCLIAWWKCKRASGLTFVITDESKKSPSWWNSIFRLVGYELRATRLEVAPESMDAGSNGAAGGTVDLVAVTLEADRLAIRTLGIFLVPLVLSYILYSLIYDEHSGWWSWIVTSASSAV